MFSLFPHKTKRCPKCHSTDLSRIKRSAIDKFFSFGSDIRKYRCEKCFNVFYVHVVHDKQEDQARV